MVSRFAWESADGLESVPGAVATGSQLTHAQGSRSRDPVATLYMKGRPKGSSLELL
jgi:hypothetical protein